METPFMRWIWKKKHKGEVFQSIKFNVVMDLTTFKCVRDFVSLFVFFPRPPLPKSPSRSWTEITSSSFFLFFFVFGGRGGGGDSRERRGD